MKLTQRTQNLYGQCEPKSHVLNANYILVARVGARVGSVRLRVRSTRLFGYQHVGIGNVKVLCWGYSPTLSPNASGFALQRNIGFNQNYINSNITATRQCILVLNSCVCLVYRYRSGCWRGRGHRRPDSTLCLLYTQVRQGSYRVKVVMSQCTYEPGSL